MQYHPKLKKAMEEIKSIVEKYDLAAVVVIHTPGHSEYLQKVNPSYSCAKFENGGMRLKAKADELGGKEKRDEMLANTANMFKLLAENTGRIAVTMMECSDFVDKATNAEHGPGGHSSHNQQNS